MIDINQLKVGDVIQHVESGNAYEVIVIDGRRIFVSREIQVTNPSEWFLVGENPYRMPARLTLHLATETDLPRLIRLVQDNQAFFGDPAAGESCIKLAADKLEELIEAQK